MKYKNMSLKNAFDSVSARRPCVRPNPGFWRQLMDYEKRLVNQQLNKNETSIPITIVSSANAKITSTSPANHPVKSSVTYNSGNNYSHSSSINLAGSSGHPYQDYDARPFTTSSRYGSSSYLYGGERGSPAISKLYKSISGHPTSTAQRYTVNDHYDNGMNHSMSSSAVSATVNPTSQHRTSLIVNDVNSSRYTIKPVNFSTTYRSSYGRM